MKQFSTQARFYIATVLIVGIALMAWQLLHLNEERALVLLAACGLASVLQTFKIEGLTERTSYNMSWVVYGFALISFGPPGAMLVLLVFAAHGWFYQPGEPQFKCAKDLIRYQCRRDVPVAFLHG